MVLMFLNLWLFVKIVPQKISPSLHPHNHCRREHLLLDILCTSYCKYLKQFKVNYILTGMKAFIFGKALVMEFWTSGSKWRTGEHGVFMESWKSYSLHGDSKVKMASIMHTFKWGLYGELISRLPLPKREGKSMCIYQHAPQLCGCVITKINAAVFIQHAQSCTLAMF